MTDEVHHSGRAIRDELRVAAPPEVVWRIWTDPDTVPSWFVSRVEGRAEVGETLSWIWEPGEERIDMRVLVADAPHRLVTEIDLPEGVTVMEVTIEHHDGHSVLRFVHSGFGDGAAWDDQLDGMGSGWLIALAILKYFAGRYLERRRKEIIVLADVDFDQKRLAEVQRTETGLATWLIRSGSVGSREGDAVKLDLGDGRTLTGVVLRQTPYETLYSWEEIEGVLELKAYRGASWGSKVGVRVGSWLKDADELVDLEGRLRSAVEKLVGVLA